MIPEENLWKLHSLLRMTRMVCEIVCPGILLLGETDRPPAEAAAFGGTSDMPELHIVNSTQLMSDLWHTVATKDTALLRRGIDRVQTFRRHRYSRITSVTATRYAGIWTMNPERKLYHRRASQRLSE